MRLTVLCTLMLCTSLGLVHAEDMGSVRTADAFQLPVGENGSGEGYYVARGYRPNGHLGEDWNGVKGGDTDLGDPVYSVANGLVVFAKNYHVGWGNVVIIRSAYYEGSDLKYVDSLYGHLLEFNVEEGQQIRRGQKIGRIGNNNGMYDAHLHLEMRKNLQIGMYRGSFPRDFTNYYSASEFIAAHRICPRGNKVVSVPINTFPATAPPSYAGPKVYTPMYAPGNAPENPAIAAMSEGTLPTPRLFAPPPPRIFVPPPEALAKPSPTPRIVAKATPTPTPPPPATPPPTPKAVAKHATPTPAPTPEPTAKVTAKVSTSPKSSPKPAATPKSVAAKTATPTPAPIAKAPPPSEKEKVADKSPVSTKPAKTTTPTPAKVAAKAPEPVAEAPTPSSPTSILDSINVEPTPSISTGAPIRRGSGTFRVDRFEDLRGKGY